MIAASKRRVRSGVRIDRSSACQRSGSCALSIAGVGGQPLRLVDQRLGGGQRRRRLLPLRDRCFRLCQLGERRAVVQCLRLRAQRLQFDAQLRQRVGVRCRRVPGQPAGELLLERRLGPLLLALALEACLQGRSGRIPACLPLGVVPDADRLPAPFQVDRRHHHRTGLLHQRLGLRQQRIGLLGLRRAALDCIDALPGQPCHAAVLVLGAVGEPAQRALVADPLGRRQPHRRVRGAEGQIDQQSLLADAFDRGAQLLAIDTVHPPTERLDDRGAHLRLGIGLPMGDQRRAVAAAARGGRPHLGRRIGAQQLEEFGRFGRQFGNAEHALRRIGVLVQRRAGKDLVQHGRRMTG